MKNLGLNLVLLIGAIVLSGGCASQDGDDDDDNGDGDDDNGSHPRLCEDPVGRYVFDVEWTSGDCFVSDGTIDVRVRNDWTVTSSVWGEGDVADYIPGSCGLEVDLISDSDDDQIVLYVLDLYDEGYGEGYIETIDIYGNHLCSHSFDVHSFIEE